MKDKLQEQISEAKKQIKEAKMYAKYYQENFKEEAEQRIHDMDKEIEECKREKAIELNDKKIELKRIEDVWRECMRKGYHKKYKKYCRSVV